MADVDVLGADVHGGDGIGAALVVEHQRLAAHGCLGALGLGRGHDGATEGLDAAALGDALGLDGR